MFRFPGDASSMDEASLLPWTPEMSGLWRRARLTYQYLGPRTLLVRALTFPLRFTPLRRFATPPGPLDRARAVARKWQRAHPQPVCVAIIDHGDQRAVAQTRAAAQRTTRRAPV